MLDVYLHDTLAGNLRREDGGDLQFRYDGRYIEEAGPPLSLNMPVREDAYPHRDCLAYFGNLLPEGGVRTQLARLAGISAENDYRLLDRFGGDVAGAVSLLGHERRRPPRGAAVLEPLDPKRLDEILVGLPQRPLGADAGGEVRLSLAGAQSKLPVARSGDGFALPHGSEIPTTHILKPEPGHFDGLVANEFFCMRLAERAGLSVSHVERARTLSGLPFLIVERYDRELTEGHLRRLHQEDLCQALGRLAAEKYQEDGGPTVQEATGLIDEHSSAPARDRLGLWSALCFNVLIGNCDAHGKNYSFLHDAGSVRLAPLYDLVSTAVYEELTTRLAMSVDGARELWDVDRRAWDELAATVGMAARYVERRMGPLIDGIVAAAEELLARPEHDEPIAREIVAGIKQRAVTAVA